MGTLTLDGLKTEVRGHLGERTDFDTRLTNIINIAQDRIAVKKPFEEMNRLQAFTSGFTSTASADKIQAWATVTADFNPREIYSLRLIDSSNSRKLEFRHPRVWDSVIPMTDNLSTARPSFYTIWDTNFEWFRVPDKAYSMEIRYNNWPTLLSGGTDKSDLDHKDEVIIDLSLSYIYNSLGKFEAAARHFAIAKSILDDHQVEDGLGPDMDLTPDWVNPRVFAGPDYWNDPFQRSIT